MVPFVGVTRISSLIFSSLLGPSGIHIGIGVLGCMGNTFCNVVMFRCLEFDEAGKAFAVDVKPFTQIETIAN
ncbi:hypothetical protein DV962_13660 [Staphylococcus pseudintermedius]|nr:hypothetical protein DV962_13660 [Staphylococcus pseudintermedius]